MLLNPLPLRRLGDGPDAADGDTCLERLRGVKVTEVRYEGSRDGVETPMLRVPGSCACWRSE